MVIFFRLRGAVRCKKVKNKNFYGTFFLAVSPFPVIIRAGNVSGFVFLRSREKEKFEKNLKKKVSFLL